MRVSLALDEPGAVIKDWAYDNTGSSIFAGMLAVPEASRALLLLMGGIGATFRRRRNRC